MDESIQQTKERLLGRGVKMNRSKREYNTRPMVRVQIASDLYKDYLSNTPDMFFITRPTIEDIVNSLYHSLIHVRKLNDRTKVFTGDVERVTHNEYKIALRIVNKIEGTVILTVINATLSESFLNQND